MKRSFLTIYLLSLCWAGFAQSGTQQLKLEELILNVTQKINVSEETQQVAKVTGVKPACLQDSSIYQYPAPGNGTFSTETKTVYAYTPFYSPATLITYNRTTQNILWAANTKTEMTYTSHEKLLSEVQQTYSNSVWMNSTKNDYTYDLLNNPSSKIMSFWKTQTNSWKASSKTSYTYTGNNSLVKELYQNVDQVSGLLINSSRYTYTNDIFNHPISMLLEYWNFNSNLWDNVEMITLTYSGNQIASYLALEWNPSNNSWRNFYKSNSTFDSQNNMTSVIIEAWNISTSTWQKDRKYLYTYSSNKNKLSETMQVWDLNTSSWQNSNRYLYTYNNKNYETSILSQGITSTTTWYDLEVTNRYYNCLTVGANEEQLNSTRLLIYPNPTHSVLNIETEKAFTTIKIINLSGQTVFISEQMSSIDVSTLEKGIYLLLLSDKTNAVLYSQKFFKE